MVRSWGSYYHACLFKNGGERKKLVRTLIWAKASRCNHVFISLTRYLYFCVDIALHWISCQTYAKPLSLLLLRSCFFQKYICFLIWIGRSQPLALDTGKAKIFIQFDWKRYLWDKGGVVDHVKVNSKLLMFICIKIIYGHMCCMLV